MNPSSSAVAEMLRSYEERLLDPAVRHDPAAVSGLLAEGFREFGSSGRIFDRATILSLLRSEPPADQPVAAISDFAFTRLGPEAALVTYKATSRSRTSLRSSVWIFEQGKWQLLFHQGTRTGG